MVGATSASPLLFGAAGASGQEYERVVNIVEAGADNSGEEPIDEVFHEEAQNDTLIEFPAGTYEVKKLHLYQLSNFAMVGENATLVPGRNYSEEQWIAGSEVEDLRMESFTLDTTGEGVAPEIVINAIDGLVLRDLHKKGYQSDGGTAFGVGTTTEDGTALLENVVATDGGKSVGIYSETVGPLTVRNCRIENFEDNGLYASAGSGPVTVENGRYWNNNIAQIRLGSPGSSVEGATLGADTSVSSGGNPVNMRGIRIADGPGPVTIENTDISMNGGQGSGGIVGAYSGGSFHVRNSRIRIQPEYTTVGSGGSYTSFGILVDSTSGDPGKRTVESTAITGGGDGYAAMGFRRDNNSVQDVCVNQGGQDRHGVIYRNSENNELLNSTIDVPGRVFVTEGESSARVAGISESGSCSGPNDTDPTQQDSEEGSSSSDDGSTSSDDSADSGHHEGGSAQESSSSGQESQGPPPEEQSTQTSTDGDGQQTSQDGGTQSASGDGHSHQTSQSSGDGSTSSSGDGGSDSTCDKK